jgi:hypothetical protein
MPTKAFVASTVLLAGSILAPAAANALTVTTPLISGSSGTLTTNPSILNFLGFNPTNFPGLTGYDLKRVTFTTQGTTAGTFTISNFNPFGTVTVNTPGQFGLTLNGTTLATNNANTTGIVPAAVYPSPGAGVGTFTITTQPQSYVFDIARVAPPLNIGTLPNFTSLNVALPATAAYTASLTGTGGGITAETTNFTLSTLLNQTFLTYEYVPGPLPILGAGAAFGWSRRLRKRIAKSA